MEEIFNNDNCFNQMCGLLNSLIGDELTLEYK